MDISISSSNFVKKKEHQALCKAVDCNSKMIMVLNSITEAQKEQLSALSKMIDLQNWRFDKELHSVSVAIVDILPPKYQKPLADRIVKILQNSRKEYTERSNEIIAELKQSIQNIDSE